MSKENTGSPVYSIPLRFRKMENLHIVFWLLKDIGWCMVWKPLGIAMIFPTLIISIIIAWRTRQYMAELTHNLAITLWISANSYWMISEFLHFDEKIVFGAVTFKHLAMVPFTLGVLVLAFYYLYYQPTHKEEDEEIVEG
ncbi:hypothetical protein [Chitinophaga sp. sic0106]|uniref:hypothetical protein n=1 Tax=Chitinophaga sp. sic0106 TaxID=2854785 RepID=UPI0021065358|nr:hypothetical protein [Chitinophaga sp. sic0106]